MTHNSIRKMANEVFRRRICLDVDIDDDVRSPVSVDADGGDVDGNGIIVIGVFLIVVM